MVVRRDEGAGTAHGGRPRCPRARGQGAVAEAAGEGRRGRFAECGVGGRGCWPLEDLKSREINLVVS